MHHVLKKYSRSLLLPVAMLLGFLLHEWCGMFYRVVPYLVFTMLFLSYSAIDVRRMRVSRLDVWLMAFQLVFCVISYVLGALFGGKLLADGMLITALTPVAASSVVVSVALGARRETVTTYTIVDNLLVAVVAPVIFSFIGSQEHISIFSSMWTIFRRIAPQIVLPLVVALLLQRLLPKVSDAIARQSSKSLYVWGLTLTLVLGKTFDNMLSPSNTLGFGTYAVIMLACVAQCAILFWVGKKIGARFGEKIAGGQQLGQKNTSFGIWMSVEFLEPISAFSMAFYSIIQNLFNSWQMYRHDRYGRL